MRCDYVTSGSGRQVHYRTAGTGPVLVMLHPSPQNSEALIPALQVFSSVCTCIAFDLPGYGLSDGLLSDEPEIADYATAILDAVGALGIDKFFIYGAATGAIVAIEIAKQWPDRVHMALIDSYGHMTDAQRKDVLDGYMPDVTARRDGGHLFTYWDMCKHLFDMFPWHSGKAADRIAMDVPPADVIHAVFLRYLQAGEGYRRAYLPAMHKEKRSHFDGLKVPTTLMRWADSVVLNLTDAMIARTLPECVSVLEAGPGFDARMAVQRDALSAFINAHQVPEHIEIEVQVPDPLDGFQRCYIDAGDMRLHGAKNMSGSGNLIVFLHGAGASYQQMIEHAQPYIGKRPVLLLDLFGHGSSIAQDDTNLGDLTCYTTALKDMFMDADEANIEIVGVGLGGAIALVLGREPAVSKVTVIDPISLTQEEKKIHCERLPSLAPAYDGTHLARAWSMVKDKALFWPWFDYRASAKLGMDANLSPRHLHSQVEDILRLSSAWRDVAELELMLDWNELIGGVSKQCQIEITITESHPCPERVEALPVKIIRQR